eukprot:TRINITY_DN12369_c0_g1_i2.p1 TRINITY_DN12369_c0_g1~~TRINITY_DN12369_c0_g1_i2.p1  ORF type:complete len:1523 (+),score=365.27 TRINITY_DN12369_c0_g1_i2:528-4571(+)
MPSRPARPRQRPTSAERAPSAGQQSRLTELSAKYKEEAYQRWEQKEQRLLNMHELKAKLLEEVKKKAQQRNRKIEKVRAAQAEVQRQKEEHHFKAMEKNQQSIEAKVARTKSSKKQLAEMMCNAAAIRQAVLETNRRRLQQEQEVRAEEKSKGTERALVEAEERRQSVLNERSTGPPGLRAVRELSRRQAMRMERIRSVEQQVLRQRLESKSPTSTTTPTHSPPRSRPGSHPSSRPSSRPSSAGRAPVAPPGPAPAGFRRPRPGMVQAAAQAEEEREAESRFGDAPDPCLVPLPLKALGRVPDPATLPWPAVGGAAPINGCQASHDQELAGSLALPTRAPDFGETAGCSDALDPHGIFPVQGVRKVPSQASEVALLVRSAVNALEELLPWASGDPSAQAWNLGGVSAEAAGDDVSELETERQAPGETAEADETHLLIHEPSRDVEAPKTQWARLHESAAMAAKVESSEPQWARTKNSTHWEETEPAEPHWARSGKLAAGAVDAEPFQPLWSRIHELAPQADVDVLKPNWSRHQQKAAHDMVDRLDCSSAALPESHPSDKEQPVEVGEVDEDVRLICSGEEAAAAAVEANKGLEFKNLAQCAVAELDVGAAFFAEEVAAAVPEANHAVAAKVLVRGAEGVSAVEFNENRQLEPNDLARGASSKAEVGVVVAAKADAAAALEANHGPGAKASGQRTPEVAAAVLEAGEWPESKVFVPELAEADADAGLSSDAPAAGALEATQLLEPKVLAQGEKGVATVESEAIRNLESNVLAHDASGKADVYTAISLKADAAALEVSQGLESETLAQETQEVAAMAHEANQLPESKVLPQGAVAEADADAGSSWEAPAAVALESTRKLEPEVLAQGEEGGAAVEFEESRQLEPSILAKGALDETDVIEAIPKKPDATRLEANLALESEVLAQETQEIAAMVLEVNRALESEVLAKVAQEAAARVLEAMQLSESKVLAPGAVAEAVADSESSSEAPAAGALEATQVLEAKVLAQGADGVASVEFEESRQQEPNILAQGAAFEVNESLESQALALANPEVAPAVLAANQGLESKVSAQGAVAEGHVDAVFSTEAAVCKTTQGREPAVLGVERSKELEAKFSGEEDVGAVLSVEAELGAKVLSEAEVGVLLSAKAQAAAALEADEGLEIKNSTHGAREVVAVVLEADRELEPNVLAQGAAAEAEAGNCCCSVNSKLSAAILIKSQLLACSETAQKQDESCGHDMAGEVVDLLRECRQEAGCGEVSEPSNSCDQLARCDREADSIHSSKQGLVPRPPPSREGSCAGGSVFTALRWCRTAAGGAMRRFRPRKRHGGDEGCVSSASSESSGARNAQGSQCRTWP